MLESYVLDAAGSRHDLDTLALKYLGQRTIHFEDIAGKGVKQLTFNQVPIEQAAPYAAEDAEVTLRLHQKLAKKLSEEHALSALYRESGNPWCPCCRGSSAMVRWSVAIPSHHTVRSWASASCLLKPKPTNWRVARLILAHPNSLARSCSTSLSCLCCARPPRGRLLPPRKCSPSWHSTTLCLRSSWSTGVLAN